MRSIDCLLSSKGRTERCVTQVDSLFANLDKAKLKKRYDQIDLSVIGQRRDFDC